MKKIVFVLAVIAVSLSSCSKEESRGGSFGAKAVKFSVSNLSNYVFKSTVQIGQDGSSPVGIYAAELGADNVQATVDGTSLTPSKTIYWKVGQTSATRFIARYPYAEGSTINGEYTIPADQSNVEAYSYQNNMMTAVQDASPDPGTVAFNFTHPFAKVVFNITNNLEADAVASVVLKNVKHKAGCLDLSTAPASVTLASDITNVTAYKTADNAYSLILMPQQSTDSTDIVVTTTLGSVYTFRITGTYTFQAGKIATAALTLDPIDGSGSSLTAVGQMSFTTSDWSAGNVATVGAVGEPVLGAYFQIGGTIYSDSDVEGGNPTVGAWGKWYNMTFSSADTWTFLMNYKESMAADETGKGFLIRIANATDHTYYRMWNESPNIGTDPYVLHANSPDHTLNIRLPETSGKYLITFNSSTNTITAVSQ